MELTNFYFKYMGLCRAKATFWGKPELKWLIKFEDETIFKFIELTHSHFYLIPYIIIENMFQDYDEHGNNLNKSIQRNKKYDFTGILEFIKFYYLVFYSIFDCRAEFGIIKYVTSFDFPEVYTDEDINQFICIIRKSLFDEGLRVQMITKKSFVTFWK